MVKKRRKAKKKTSPLFIAVIILALILLAVQTMEFQLVDEPVKRPGFTSLTCENQGPEDLTEFIPDEGKTYACPFGNFETYDNCGFQITKGTSLISKYVAYDCPIDSTSLNVCTKLSSTSIISPGFGFEFEIDAEYFTIKPDRKLYINPDTVTGKMEIHASGQKWGLTVVQPNNFRYTTSSCDYASLGLNYIKIGGKSYDNQSNVVQITGKVLPDQNINIPTEYLRVERTSALITRSDIEGGDPIYITTPGKYQQTRRDDAGVLLVFGPMIDNDKIECVPRISCNDDATQVISQGDVSCDDLLGVASGYLPLPDDEETYCVFQCDELVGKGFPTSDCVTKDFIKGCSGDTPFFNDLTGECEGKPTSTKCEPGYHWVEETTKATIPILQQDVTRGYCAPDSSDAPLGLYILIGLLIFGLLMLFTKKGGNIIPKLKQ